MIDIAVNNSGDFILEQKLNMPKMKLFWAESPHQVLRLLFRTGRNTDEPRNKDGLRLSFRVNEAPPLKSCHAAHDIEELRQRIRILLRTELTEIKSDESYGTTLRREKHKDITNLALHETIRKIVLEAVSDYLANPKVYVEKRETDTPFSCQNLNVYIYDGRYEIYEFEMEEI